MSSAERHLNQFPPKAQQAIETIYTTVESQPDQTDWLTVVSNLRQINRQLVEQIARLEQALASSQQTLATHKEENQSHEITILQQQDELKITHDRVGALFQQLETSHQIGQRQQILVETLSQQLEIAQAIISQLEAENNEASQQCQEQTEKLTKTEQIAAELHRQLQQQATLSSSAPLTSAPEAEKTPEPETIPTAPASSAKTTAILNPALDLPTTEVNPPAPSAPITDPVKHTTAQNTIPSAPSIPDELVPAWTPTPPTTRREEPVKPASQVKTPSWNTTVSLPKSSSQVGWREEIANTKISSTYKPNSDPITNPAPSATPTPPPPAEIVNKESTAAQTDGTPAKPSPNWPAPTVTKSQPVTSTKTIVDVPKFSKK